MGVHDWWPAFPLRWPRCCSALSPRGMEHGPLDALAGFYAGLVLATSIGLFLFTRILIPDVMLT